MFGNAASGRSCRAEGSLTRRNAKTYRKRTSGPLLPTMNKLKPFLITAVIALAAVAIASRVPALRKLVGF